MIKTLITPEEISKLARPCYADEEKALAYIVEAEQNNIKPAIGDDLFIQLKEGGQTFLLEGGIYERNGKRYYLNGIKRALAYFVISRLYESSTTELTRQGVVNRRSEYSDNADNSEIISVSRETYAIANRYMEEVEKYLGTDVKNTSQRVRFDLIGGGSNGSRQCRPSSPSANINVVQTLGNSDKDVISQAGVTREFNAVRTEAEDKLAEAKAYTDKEIAKAAIGGGGDIDLSDYAKTAYVDDEVQKAKDYTDEKFNSIDIPTALSELSDDADHRLVTDVEKQKWDGKSDFSGDYNDLKNKPTIPAKTSQLENDSNFAEGMDIITIDKWVDSENIAVSEEGYLIGIHDNQRLIVTAVVDKPIYIIPIMSEIANTATMEIMFSIDDVPEIGFYDDIMWAKEPSFNTNKTYAVTIECNNVDGDRSYLAMYAEFDYLNTEE